MKNLVFIPDRNRRFLLAARGERERRGERSGESGIEQIFEMFHESVTPSLKNPGSEEGIIFVSPFVK
jgi:hypothetical protein